MVSHQSDILWKACERRCASRVNDDPRVAYSTWSFDDLITAFSYKLRRLLVVDASKRTDDASRIKGRVVEPAQNPA